MPRFFIGCTVLAGATAFTPPQSTLAAAPRRFHAFSPTSCRTPSSPITPYTRNVVQHYRDGGNGGDDIMKSLPSPSTIFYHLVARHVENLSLSTGRTVHFALSSKLCLQQMKTATALRFPQIKLLENSLMLTSFDLKGRCEGPLGWWQLGTVWGGYL